MQKLLTVLEVSQILATTKARTYELIRRGILPAVHLGRQVRVDERGLEDFLRAGGTSIGASSRENS